MLLSVSSFFITLAMSSLMILLFELFISQKKFIKFLRMDVMIVLAIVIIIRLLLPFEYTFTITLPFPWLMNHLRDILYSRFFASFSVLNLLCLIWCIGIVIQSIRYLYNIKKCSLIFKILKNRSTHKCIADYIEVSPKHNYPVWFEDYNYKDAYLILKEMVDTNVLNLTEKHLVTDRISLYIGYSKDRRKPCRGTCKITNRTNSYRILMEEFHLLYKRIVDPNYPIRQIALSFGNVRDEIYEQYDLFADMEKIEKERKLQQTLVNIRNKYGKNAVLKGMNYLPKGTARYRNMTIGGHKA